MGLNDADAPSLQTQIYFGATFYFHVLSLFPDFPLAP